MFLNLIHQNLQRNMSLFITILYYCRGLFFLQLILIVCLQGVKVQDTVKLSDAFEFEVNVLGDFIVNFNGGISQGTTYIGLESITLMVDTEKAGIWKNGTFFIHGLNTHGKGLSETLTGDLQILSNIEAGNYYGLYEYYYSPQVGNLSVLFGQHDMNSEFAGTKYSANKINKAIQQLIVVNQQNAASSEELAASAEKLASQAEFLKEIEFYSKVDYIKSGSQFKKTEKVKKVNPAATQFAAGNKIPTKKNRWNPI